MPECSLSSDGARARVVLLGASNLTLGLATVVQTARRFLGSPLEIVGALGHGRSYGQRSTVIVRSLPGIRECGLWEALERPFEGDTFALLTDIGNDVGYEVPVAQIGEWVEGAMERLSRVGARTVMTLLPLGSLRRLKPFHYYAARTIFFPGSRLTFGEARSRTEVLDSQLRDTALRLGVTTVEPEAHWYGLDPIHVRRRCRGEAWRTILGGWCEEPVEAGPVWSPPSWVVLQLLRPDVRWLFGREQRTPQPAATLDDGTTLSLY